MRRSATGHRCARKLCRAGWKPAFLSLGVVPMLASCIVTSGLHIVATPDVPTPSGPPPFRSTDFATAFLAVDGVTPQDVWGVGGVGWHIFGSWSASPFAAHWDGRSWKAFPISASGLSGPLTAVTAVSPTDVWATGASHLVGSSRTDALLHFDGRNWQSVNVPAPAGQSVHLASISAVSATNIWAVGLSSAQQTQPYVAHFNGTNWQRVTFPALAAPGELTSVSTAGPNAVFATGKTSPSSATTTPVFGQWNGTTWGLLPAPANTGHSVINAVGAVNSTQAWAVGYDAAGVTPDVARAWHWVGGHWLKTTPVSHSGSYLTSVDARDPNHVWAAGYPGLPRTGLQESLLIVRWTTAWAPMYSVPANPDSAPLRGVRLIQRHVFTVGGSLHTMAVQN
jgi:hypothetical protein